MSAQGSVELDTQARARLADLRFVGELSQVDANARGLRLVSTEHGAAAARDHITVTALLDEEERIQDIRFASLATGHELLTFDLLMQWCLGKRLDVLPTGTPETLTAWMAEQGFSSAAAVVGTGATNEPFYILLKLSGRGQQETEPTADDGDKAAAWEEAGLFEKVRLVEQTLDDHVRAALASDGGGIDLLDLKPDTVNTLVVEYQGACGSCSSSIGGTMQFIEDTLELQIGVPFRLDVQSTEAAEGEENYFGL